MTVPDYKSTIFLPKTDFPMRGDLPQREPVMIQNWEQNKIYEKILAKNSSGSQFTLPDGPPYANGSIHIGHALNKVLKDIVIKYKNMRGFQTPFIPGWDCHGLPIEHKVMKDLVEKKQTKTDAEILQLCREEAQKWVGTQKGQFKRLGILADWENPYRTMDPEYEAEEVREFARAFKKGVIYRGSKPVYWNWTLKTALADAEVEYHPHRSPSIYVKFSLTDKTSLEKLGNPEKPVSVVIWTTTPWTLPANVAVCLHPDFVYTLFDTGTEYLLFAKDLKESVEKETGLNLQATSREYKGKDLELLKARHPWIDRDSLFVLGLHVTLDAGTGVVHTAPGHGADDFKVGLTYKLPVLCPVDDSGKLTSEVEEFAGLNIFKANPVIVEKLRNMGKLLAFKEFEHSYPHCWRSKTPLIFRTTPQWFIGLDLEGNSVRKKTLAELDNIQFFPAWGEARLRSMMEGRPDWCLSRQRIWGVPIPVLICVATGEPYADYDVMMKIAEVIEKQGGIDAFYRTPADQFVGQLNVPANAPTGFGSQGFKHGRDILDVWFDSGVVHAAVQRRRKGMKVPADLYLEGSDQHRGWFNTSLLSSMVTNEATPYKALVTHGFVMDPQGRKMSKSLGNVVDPQEVTAKSGAEIIRLWTAYEDYGQDLSCGPNELTRVAETYRKVRNSMRFLLGNLEGFHPQTDMVELKDLSELDRWALHELFELNQKVTQAYDQYEFYKVYHAINNFFTVTLSANYGTMSKDRLYTWKQKGIPRRGAQTVMYLITDYTVRMLAPILSFLCEEVYGYLPDKSAESVFLTDYPLAPKEWHSPELKKRIDEFFVVRDLAQKEMENLRVEKVIGSSLEASLNITAPKELMEQLQKFKDLKEFLIVSDIRLSQGDQLRVQAVRADGEKCLRCWVYSTEISKEEKHFGTCPKCQEALS